MCWNRMEKLSCDESGAVLIYVAVAITGIMGFAGLAIDAGHWYTTQRSAQVAADAAAVAAGYEVQWGSSEATIEDRAEEQAVANGFAASTVTVNHPPASGPSAGDPDAVEVIIQQPTQGFFSSLIMSDTVDVTARSVTNAVGGMPACLVALEPSDNAITLTGSTAVEANGCAVQVNSSNSSAITTSGGSTVTAAEVNVVGDVSDPGAISPEPVTGVPPMADPLAYLTPPPQASDPCDYNNYKAKDDGPIDPGVYCGGLTIQADVTMNPGIYVIRGGGFSGSGGPSIQGDGVGIYLGTDSYMDFSGGAVIDLSAPTSGPMAGLVIYQGPDADPGKTSSLSGGADVLYEGTLYFPDQDVVLTGGSTATIPPPFTTYVAKTFTITGGGTLTFGSDYESSAVPVMPSMSGRRIALFE